MRCPLCNSRDIRPAPVADDLLVCGDCCELLFPRELVRRATWRTRRRYARENAQ